MVVSPVPRKVIRILATILFIAGFTTFIGQAIVSTRVFGQMRGIAWPVGYTSDAIRLPDGRYAVPLEHIDRVQIYSADLRFQYGWQVAAHGGAFTLLSGPEGRLEIYTARGDYHYVFDPGGRLLSSRNYDWKTETYPGRDPGAVSLKIPSPWWTLIWRGPFYSWATGMIGMLLLFATTTREELEAQRRKAAERAMQPRGSTLTVVRTNAYRFIVRIRR